MTVIEISQFSFFSLNVVEAEESPGPARHAIHATPPGTVRHSVVFTANNHVKH